MQFVGHYIGGKRPTLTDSLSQHFLKRLHLVWNMCSQHYLNKQNKKPYTQ